MRSLRKDFQVLNARDTLLYTSSDRDLARDWAKAHAVTHPGAHVEEVEVFEARRVVYRPRPAAARRDEFTVPAMGAVSA